MGKIGLWWVVMGRLVVLGRKMLGKSFEKGLRSIGAQFCISNGRRCHIPLTISVTCTYFLGVLQIFGS